MKRTPSAVLISAVMIGALAAPVWAQQDEVPEQGVARLSLMNGDVTVRRGDSGELVAGENNAPLVAADHVITGPGSRAEVQFDYANMIRLAPASEVRLGELADRNYLIQVASGMTTFRVLRDSSAAVEISTPVISVRPTEKGTYRVLVRPDGSTEVTVREGRAEIFSQRGSEILREGQTLEARGTASDPEYMISSAIPGDDWDRWNQNRDNDLEKSQSYRYVSRDIYGADDLDGYGRWVYDAPYGNVWVPNVSVGWAPYRVGRWVDVNYYGWTWLSGDPWGWAPYHYGSWYSSSYGWAWYPGVVGPRYYWSPARVGFFGWGSSTIGIGWGYGNTWGFPNVGWVPLAPYEVYRPWYGRNFRNGSFNNTTIVNNINITNIYRNSRNVNGRMGVTSVKSGNFGRGRVDNNNNVQINNRDLNRAGDVRGRLPFDANAQNRRFSDRDPAVTPVSQRGAGQAFVTRPDRGGKNSPDSKQPANRQAGNKQGPDSNARAAAAASNGQPNVGNNSRTSTANNTGDKVSTSPGWSRFEPQTAPQTTSGNSRAAASGSNGQTNSSNNSGNKPATNAADKVSSGAGWRRFDPQTDNTPANVLRPGNNRDSTNANSTTNGNSSRTANQPQFVTAPRNSGNANSGGTVPRVSESPRSAPSGNSGSGNPATTPKVTQSPRSSDPPRSAPSGNSGGGGPAARIGGSNPGGNAARVSQSPRIAQSAPRAATSGNSGGGNSAFRSGGGNPGGSAPRVSQSPRIAQAAPRAATSGNSGGGNAAFRSGGGNPGGSAPRVSQSPRMAQSAPRAATSGNSGGGAAFRSGGGNPGGGGARVSGGGNPGGGGGGGRVASGGNPGGGGGGGRTAGGGQSSRGR